jgi:hypothetical protein
MISTDSVPDDDTLLTLTPEEEREIIRVVSQPGAPDLMADAAQHEILMRNLWPAEAGPL